MIFFFEVLKSSSCKFWVLLQLFLLFFFFAISLEVLKKFPQSFLQTCLDSSFEKKNSFIFLPCALFHVLRGNLISINLSKFFMQ